MPLGGIDFVLTAPARECLGDVILRACRRHWRFERCFFQDANDEENVYPIDDAWVWNIGVASREFFVYKNEKAVTAWADGPTRDNVNTMIHFIIGEPLPADPQIVEVAMVCDKRTPEMDRLVTDLRECFGGLAEALTRKIAA